MPLGPSDTEAAEASPCRPAWVPQSYHEPLLVSQLQAARSATLRFGTRLIGLEALRCARAWPYVLKQPDVDGAVLARRGREDRWGLSRERPRGAAGMEDLPPGDLVTLIRTATGVPDLDLTVERLSRFSFVAQIAEHYRRGNVFLIGDAAHRMTPRGGTGMNTGIQDGFDIAWKLAWALRGWAGPELLDSYETERRLHRGHDRMGRAAEGSCPRHRDGRGP